MNEYFYYDITNKYYLCLLVCVVVVIYRTVNTSNHSCLNKVSILSVR